MSKKKLTLKILFILIFTDFLETFTQYCFKKTALPESGLEMHHFLDALIFLKAMLLSPFLWIALLSVLLTFILWSTILSRIDLSVAVPVCSFSYVTIPLISIIFFHEKVSILRWSGILFIIIGIILVSLSSARKETEPE